MGFFGTRGRVYKPIEEIDLSPDSKETYLRANVKVNVCIYGKCLKFTYLSAVSTLISFAEFEEPPVFLPKYSSEDAVLKEQESQCVEPDLSPSEQVQQAMHCLPLGQETVLSDPASNFHRWTIQDYSRAYSSGITTPLKNVIEIIECEHSDMAAIVAFSLILIVVNQWMKNDLSEIFEHAQLFGGTWPGAYSALCFSCGYFAYDQWDMLHYRLYSGWIPSILVHHLILLVCFTLALYRNVTINYLILTLICELHSIFLHVRKVRRMAGVRDAKSTVVKVEWMVNWITFFVARLASHILITYKTCMNLLNVFLGLDLLKAYRREKNDQLKRQE
ncbi:TLC domain-containing protein 2 [Cinnamomum micranthum f. kanehirae]|uniref:TLC domain-containing protein 2 n=1 Tax=Cinnamomum micranthum f. kanehirae TaxID=337451 RepID=A0A3S3NLH1_9MAGN|nr:TLC domain-containing protein 2 [Cinnamomum micranthum f. kanehirae]